MARTLTEPFDPNASPPLSRHVAKLIGDRARWVEFPLIGHNVRHISPRAVTIVATFINNQNGRWTHRVLNSPNPSGSCHDDVTPRPRLLDTRVVLGLCRSVHGLPV